jgi:hypothetical protein
MDHNEKPNDLLQRIEDLESLVAQILTNQTETQDSAEVGDAPDEALTIEAFGGLASQLEARIDGWDLQHFKGSEFTPYWSRTKNGVSNSAPPQNLWNNIAKTLAVLQRLRDEMEASITLTSTYRDPDYNAAVGGEPNSLHKKFKAIDFVCAKGTPAQWASKLKSYRGDTFINPADKQPFQFRGGIGRYGTFVHVDTRGVDKDWTG